MVKDRFTQAALDAIFNTISGAFTLSIGNCNELHNSDMGESEVLTDIKKELIEMFLNITDWDKGDQSKSAEKGIMANKCYDIKNRIVDCRMQLSVLEAIVERQRFFLLYYNTMKFEKSHENEFGVGYKSTIIQEINMLLNAMTGDTKNIFKSGLISYAPLMVSKLVYNDYLFKGLTEMYSYQNEPNIKLFIEFCRLYINFENDGVVDYPQLSTKIKGLEEYNIYYGADTGMLEGETAEKFDKLHKDILKEISSNSENLLALIEMVNFLIIILNYSLGFDTVTAEIPVARDLYYLFKENYEKGGLEEYSFEDRINECMSGAVDAVNKAIENYKKIAKKQRVDKLEDTDIGLANTVETVNRLFFERLMGVEAFLYLGNDEEKFLHTTKERAQTLARQTVEMLQNSLSGMSTRVRKLHNRFFMNYIPCYFTDKEAVNYIINAFENSPTSEILFTAGYIFDVVRSQEKNNSVEINA